MEPNVPRRAAPMVRLIGIERRHADAQLAGGGKRSSVAVGVSAVAVSIGGVGLDEAWCAPGDLDPSFGEVGRTGDFGYATVLRSLDVGDDESIRVAGGVEYSYYCYYYGGGCELVDTLDALSALGVPDPAFVPPDLTDTIIYDAALQSDGKLVATGRARQGDDTQKLVVLRLMPDGALDGGFGTAGQAVLSNGTGDAETGHAVLVHSDGRIVVAGSSGGRLMVARLLVNGTLDTTFGANGVFVSSKHATTSTPVRIDSVPGGGYRVTGHGSGTGCALIALTQAGALDTSFGTGGSRPAPGAGSDEISCTSLTMLDDGRMLLAGSRNLQMPYLARALPDGSNDATFHGQAALSAVKDVTALAVSRTTGRIFVAGADPSGLSGATIVRLLADGSLDTLFGVDGATVVDLDRDDWAPARILDMQVRANDALVVAGDAFQSPFVARLLGDGVTGGPGVLGVTLSMVDGTETAGEARIKVRRTGGSTGAIEVSYSTTTGQGPPAARPGHDFTAVTGTLSWADGDHGDREIVVPILANSLAEDPEFFEVVLADAEGGAGFGLRTSSVQIPGDDYAAGRFTLHSTLPRAREGDARTLHVSRENHSAGAVSVMVRVAGGTAQAGQDFNPGWTDVTLNWADGDLSTKTVALQFVDDDVREPQETVSFELVSPTGGALLAETTGQVTIAIDDARRNRSGGGGTIGGLAATLLAALAALRRMRRARA